MIIGHIFAICLAAYFVGVVVKRFVNPSVGDAIEVVSAVVIVLVLLLAFLGVPIA